MVVRGSVASRRYSVARRPSVRGREPTAYIISGQRQRLVETGSATIRLGKFRFLWTPAQRKRASMLYFANVFFIYLFLWPPYSPALVNGGSRKFYTLWNLSGIEEVTTWIFSWSPLNYRVGQKVTKFRIFSDPARKLFALTPERGRIL